jgi:hypothetical protein
MACHALSVNVSAKTTREVFGLVRCYAAYVGSWIQICLTFQKKKGCTAGKALNLAKFCDVRKVSLRVGGNG